MIKEGILNINKPQGMTSHDCIYVVRRLTGIKRVGHTGTLDPNATGVLPVCIGSCARIAEYTDLDLKKYECTMILGLVTDTQDIWGEIISDRRNNFAQEFPNIDEGRIREAFAPMGGLIDQYPPKYSAVRIGGRRLYEYARAGEEVEIKPRKAYIESLEITGIDISSLRVSFIVTCGKGTYIRTICQDVGEALGCGAAMEALTRTASGIFTIENAVSMDRLRQLIKEKEEGSVEDEVNSLILAPDYPLIHFGKVTIKTAERSRWFINGGHIRFSETCIERTPEYEEKEAHMEIRPEYRRAYCIYGYLKPEEEGRLEQRVFLGVAFYNEEYKKLKADKIFRRNNE